MHAAVADPVGDFRKVEFVFADHQPGPGNSQLVEIFDDADAGFLEYRFQPRSADGEFDAKRSRDSGCRIWFSI